jgi:hypothetical protein
MFPKRPTFIPHAARLPIAGSIVGDTGSAPIRPMALPRRRAPQAAAIAILQVAVVILALAVIGAALGLAVAEGL